MRFPVLLDERVAAAGVDAAKLLVRLPRTDMVATAGVCVYELEAIAMQSVCGSRRWDGIDETRPFFTRRVETR